ncbi:MAG: type II toxin-antitoxin system prevent-host-death family antitoxin, partial [Acidobacteriota bacterium]
LTADVQVVVQQAHDNRKPIVLTAEGKEVAVLMSVELFEELSSAIANPHLQRAVEEAEGGIAKGRWVEHAEVEAKLREWAGNEP